MLLLHHISTLTQDPHDTHRHTSTAGQAHHPSLLQGSLIEFSDSEASLRHPQMAKGLSEGDNLGYLTLRIQVKPAREGTSIRAMIETNITVFLYDGFMWMDWQHDLD